MAKISFHSSVILSEEVLTLHRYYLKWRLSQRRKGKMLPVMLAPRLQAPRILGIHSQETLQTDSVVIPLLPIPHTPTTTTILHKQGAQEAQEVLAVLVVLVVLLPALLQVLLLLTLTTQA